MPNKCDSCELNAANTKLRLKPRLALQDDQDDQLSFDTKKATIRPTSVEIEFFKVWSRWGNALTNTKTTIKRSVAKSRTGDLWDSSFRLTLNAKKSRNQMNRQNFSKRKPPNDISAEFAIFKTLKSPRRDLNVIFFQRNKVKGANDVFFAVHLQVPIAPLSDRHDIVNENMCFRTCSQHIPMCFIGGNVRKPRGAAGRVGRGGLDDQTIFGRNRMIFRRNQTFLKSDDFANDFGRFGHFFLSRARSRLEKLVKS